VPLYSGYNTAWDGRLYHAGTQQADGSAWFNNWAPLPGPDGAFGGFDGIYPYPEFSPSLSSVASGPGGHSAVSPPGGPAASDGSVAGTNGTNISAARSSGTDGSFTASTSTVSSDQETMQSSNSGFVIVPYYDSSVTSSTLAASFESAVTAAIDFYESEIATPITIGVTFSYGTTFAGGVALPAGDVSGSHENSVSFDTYDVFEPALEAHDTSVAGASPLPSSDPFGPGDAYLITPAEGLALGITTGTSVFGGDVALSSQDSFFFGTSGAVPSGEYDAVGALEHEISEVMGRYAIYQPNTSVPVLITTGNPTFGQTLNVYSPLDLFRYTSAGTLANTGTAAYFSINDGAANLDQFNNATTWGGDPGDWSSIANDISPVADDSYDAFLSTGEPNTVSATDLTVLEMLGYSLAAACYAAGTRVLAAQGEVPIERLAVGDQVRTRFGGLLPVRWIGQRRIDCRQHRDPLAVRPVRVAANAFGAGLPSRDLFLSPDHAVAMDGVLIPIRLLANGGSIRQETDTATVHYFHLELDRHDLLWAEGLEAESYLDTGNRAMFANAADAGTPDAGAEAQCCFDTDAWLHRDTDAQLRREMGSCLPFLDDPAQVEQLWRRLAARSVQLGMLLPQVATTPDPALRVAAGSSRFAPVLHDGGCYTFVLPPLPNGARLQSRCAVPSALRPWLEDRRLLGVMVQRLTIRLSGAVIDLALDNPRLNDGWWLPEQGGGGLWRWTDGDAALPAIGGPSILTVALGDTMPYPLAEPESAGALPPVPAGFLPAGALSRAGGLAPGSDSTRFW